MYGDGISVRNIAMATDQDVYNEEEQTNDFCNYFDRGQPERLTVREVAMIRNMNEITDETGWHLKIFDDQHLQRWRSECDPMINNHAWSWIITELQAKAREHDNSHSVLAFDVGHRVCKSDVIFDDSIVQSLRDYVCKTHGRGLSADDLVTHLLNPWSNPLIYGHTDVLSHCEMVDLSDPMSSIGKGSPIVSPTFNGTSRSAYDGYSALSQLLPFEVTFGEAPDQRVKIVSYINNGDDVLKSEGYTAMEHIIGNAVQAWNLVLLRIPDRAKSRPRTPLRIRTYGFATVPQWPSFAIRLPFITGPEDRKWKEALRWTQTYVEQPDHPSRNPDLYCDWREEFEDLSECHSGIDLLRSMSIKWKGMQHIKHPDPGVSFTYYDWLAGRTGKAIHSKTKYWHEEEAGPDDDDHEYYDVDLQSEFSRKGLQIVARMTSIDLDSSNPKFAGNDWQVDGLANDHIVSTFIYCFDTKNITVPKISFRQFAPIDLMQYRYDTSGMGLSDLQEMLGIDYEAEEHIPADQMLGTINCPQDRSLTWPNTLQYKHEPFELVDASTPGHMRFLVLSLVDPTQRLISTKNVPPQQHDWWFREAKQAMKGTGIDKLPQELVDRISDCARKDAYEEILESVIVDRENLWKMQMDHLPYHNIVDLWMA